MKLKIISSSALGKIAKCQVHTSGRLGFSEGGSQKMNLIPGHYVVFARDEESAGEQDLYAFVVPDASADGFKVRESRNYYSLNTKSLFDELGVDYKNTEVVTIYDITQTGEYHEGKPVFKLKKRTQERQRRKRKAAALSD
jgi:hypothetical protein